MESRELFGMSKGINYYDNTYSDKRNEKSYEDYCLSSHIDKFSFKR